MGIFRWTNTNGGQNHSEPKRKASCAWLGLTRIRTGSLGHSVSGTLIGRFKGRVIRNASYQLSARLPLASWSADESPVSGS
jgi:hypothetical protein